MKDSRVRWCDMKRMDNGLVYKLAVWLGLIHSPSMHFYGRCNVRDRRGLHRAPLTDRRLR